MTTTTESELASAPAPATTALPMDQPAEIKPHRFTLLVVLAGVFLSGLDFFIVNVAIPSMQVDLQASSAHIQFIVAGYALAYGAGMIVAARLGDRYGRMRMFTLAMALFTLTSVACGVAPNANTLVVSRLLQGVSSALMAPQVLSILGTVYHGEQRAKAINAYGMTLGISAVFGQLLGGLLIKANVFDLDWRTCFLVNVPIGVAVVLAAPRMVPESRSPQRPRLDLTGMVLVTLGLVAVILPMIEGRQQGWPVWSWVSLGASVPLFTAFALYEARVRRTVGSPLIDLALFRERAFTVGLLAQLVFWTGQASFFLVFAIYTQQGRGLDALGAGLIFIAIGVGYMATSASAHYFAQRMGRQVIAAGGLFRVVGAIALIITVHQIGVGGNIGWLIPGLVVDGAGMGLALAPLAGTVLARISPQHAGEASGVLNTGLQVGNALGVAAIGVLFYNGLSRYHGIDAVAQSFSYSLAYIIGVGLVLAALVQFLPRGVYGQSAETAVPAPEAEATAAA